MTEQLLVTCDGCGQPATSEHISRRLQRLEWATRFRPVHINTVLLSAVSPDSDDDFLYSPSETFSGESLIWLAAAGVDPAGKSPEAVHAEFQKAGFLLTYVLECPLEKTQKSDGLQNALQRRIRPTVTRIRRSFRPKRVALVSAELYQFVGDLSAQELACDVVLSEAKPFALSPNSKQSEISKLREALATGLGVR